MPEHRDPRSRPAPKQRSWLARGFAQALSLLLGTGLLAAPAAALVYTYENTTGGAIPFVGNNGCSTNITASFAVAESFTVTSVALAVNISHSERGDVRGILQHPDGTDLVVLAQGTDTDDNYDVLISSTRDGIGSFPLDDDDVDPVTEPYYSRLVYLATIDSTFAGKSSSGTWSLRLCDRDNNGVNGTLNRAMLILQSGEAPASRCTSTIVAYDWGSNGSLAAFSNATVGDVTISQGATADFAGTGSTANFQTVTSTQGAHTGYYAMSMDATAVGGTQTNEEVGQRVTFTFSPPVADLRFSFLDVDTNNTGWEDQVSLVAVDSVGAAVRYAMTPVGTVQLAGDTAEGDTSVDPTSTDGNVDYAFETGVASLTMTYTQGSAPNTENVFMIIGVSDFVFCAFDFGDAPATYGTTLAGDGARHVLGLRNLWLGANPPDGEADGAPSAAASDDDTTQIGGVNDEDGVASFPACPQDGSYAVSVTASNFSGADATLVGYLDWGRDGVFDTGADRSASVNVPNGTSSGVFAVTWSSVPANCGGTEATFARFRISTDATSVLSPTGQAPDGEVEDYEIEEDTLPVTLAAFESGREGRGWWVAWWTADESLNAGFRLWGIEGSGARRLVASLPSAAGDSLEAQRYEVRVAGDWRGFELEDLAIDGRNRLHGPFAAGARLGAEPARRPVDWAAARAETGVRSVAERAAAARPGGAEDWVPEPGAVREGLLLVSAPGIQRVTYEELLAAGIDLSGIPAAQIALLDRGKPVARRVEPPGIFGRGSYLKFLALPELTLASPVDAFELRVDARSALVAGPLPHGGGAAAPAEVRALDRHAPERAYSYSAPNGDPWYDQRLLAWGAPAATARTFDLPDLAPGPVALTVELWGGLDFPEPGPDHHVVVRLNGSELAAERFDGLVPWTRTFEVEGLVAETGNQLEIALPSDTGHEFDIVHLEGFAVAYPRRAVAREGRFEGRPGGRAYEVEGFGSEPVSVWLGGRRPAAGELLPKGGRITVPDGEREAWAASPAALRRPAVQARIPAAKTHARAAYAIVTHPAFAEHLGPLVGLLAGRGLTVDVTTVDRIYAAYSDHAASAEAIGSFLAASRRQGGLRYALLVGADSFDPHDHLGLGSISYLPTAYRALHPVIHFAPSDEALADLDGDSVPDFPLGRLPVRRLADLDAAVGKLAAWEANLGRAREALLVAGASDDAGRGVATINETYAASLAGWGATLAQVDDLGAAETRRRTLAALEAGTPLVSYVGHSSSSQWDFTPVLRWSDVAGLENASRPSLVAQWGCWNSYHVDPAYHAMSSELLFAPNGGAAAAIGATTLTSDASHRALGQLFFEEIGKGTSRTLGDAFLSAKRRLHAAQGAGAADALLGMTLLGDPAMPLPTAAAFAGRR